MTTHRFAPLTASLLALLLALPAAAQEMVTVVERPPPRIFGFVGGGVSFPLSDTADNFNPGYAFNGGLGFNFVPALGIQAEAFWSRYYVNKDLFNVTNLDANHRMQYGSLNFVLRTPGQRALGFYLLGGGGLYYRRVQITQFEGTAVLPVCDPWLYYCYPSAVGVEQVLGTRSSTDWGLNGGAGITLRLGYAVKLFLEGRYHYIFGPEFTDAGGQRRNANGQYVPVMFGLRFE